MTVLNLNNRPAPVFGERTNVYRPPHLRSPTSKLRALAAPANTGKEQTPGLGFGHSGRTAEPRKLVKVNGVLTWQTQAPEPTPFSFSLKQEPRPTAPGHHDAIAEQHWLQR